MVIHCHKCFENVDILDTYNFPKFWGDRQSEGWNEFLRKEKNKAGDGV